MEYISCESVDRTYETTCRHRVRAFYLFPPVCIWWLGVQRTALYRSQTMR